MASKKPVDKVKVVIYMTSQQHIGLKLLAIQKRTTMGDVVLQGLEALKALGEDAIILRKIGTQYEPTKPAPTPVASVFIPSTPADPVLLVNRLNPSKPKVTPINLDDPSFTNPKESK